MNTLVEPLVEKKIETPPAISLDETDYDDKADWVTAMRAVKEMLDEVGVRYWLDMGTLLGAVREGKFIDWDNDIDLSANISDAPKILQLVDKFADLGYRVDVTDSAIDLSAKGLPTMGIAFYRQRNDVIWIDFLVKPTKFDWILRHFRRVATKIIYQEYHRELPKVERYFYAICPAFMRSLIRSFSFWLGEVLGEKTYPLVIPSKFVEKLDKLNFYRIDFPIPSQVEEYLAWMYGDDWRTPKSDWRWEDTKSINYDFVQFNRRNEYRLLGGKENNPNL